MGQEADKESGPLTGMRAVEIAGRGPIPFAGMMLADMGAEVLRVDRPAPPPRPQAPDHRLELYNRGRRSMVVDLKRPGGPEVVLRLLESADAVIEGYRPGVAERLGIGPDVCLARNPRLVYGRGTGWGQSGPLAAMAGHDLNYIAVTGALDAIGHRGGPPEIPLNLLGDYAGGGMVLAFGIVCALWEASRSGQGQVVDAAMVDGASLLMTLFHGRRLMGTWSSERGTNYVDSGAPFYNVYETQDGKYVAIGPIEEKFQRELFQAVEVDIEGIDLPVTPVDRRDWDELHRRLERVFRTRTRAEWTNRLGAVDGCFSPVLGLDEVVDYPHHRARESFPLVEGVPQPAPAPRFSRTRPRIRSLPPEPGEHTDEALRDWGFDPGEVDRLRAAGVVR